MLYSIFLFCNFNSIPKSTYPSETKHPLLQSYPLQQQPLNPPLALIHLSRKLNTVFIEHNRFPHVNTTARWARLLSESSFKSCINFELACPSMLASQSLSISENTRSHEDNPPTPFFEGERVGGGGSHNRFISSLLPRHRLIMNRWYTHTHKHIHRAHRLEDFQIRTLCTTRTHTFVRMLPLALVDFADNETSRFKSVQKIMFSKSSVSFSRRDFF